MLCMTRPGDEITFKSILMTQKLKVNQSFISDNLQLQQNTTQHNQIKKKKHKFYELNPTSLLEEAGKMVLFD